MEYDNLENVVFNESKSQDTERNNLLMKYFGSSGTQKYLNENFTNKKKYFSIPFYILKGSILSSFILGGLYLFNTDTIKNSFSFVYNPFIKNMLIILISFCFVFLIIISSNSVLT
uniref:Uncharacterized protein n=1 Tax=viral metagenome TaxID=1070528 RepID=A0A6C0JQ10_9ZZZZ